MLNLISIFTLVFSLINLSYDQSGEFVDATVMPIPEQVKQMPLRKTTADLEIVFIAKNVPPLGFTSYFIQLKPIVTRRIVKSPKLFNMVEIDNNNKRNENNIGIASSITKGKETENDTIIEEVTVLSMDNHVAIYDNIHNTTENPDKNEESYHKIVPIFSEYKVNSGKTKDSTKHQHISDIEVNKRISLEEQRKQINKTKMLISKYYFGDNRTVPGRIFAYKFIKNQVSKTFEVKFPFFIEARVILFLNDSKKM